MRTEKRRSWMGGELVVCIASVASSFRAAAAICVGDIFAELLVQFFVVFTNLGERLACGIVRFVFDLCNVHSGGEPHVASQSRVSRVPQHQCNISCLFSINTSSGSFSFQRRSERDMFVWSLPGCRVERDVIFLHPRPLSQPSSTFVGLKRSM